MESHPAKHLVTSLPWKRHMIMFEPQNSFASPTLLYCIIIHSLKSPIYFVMTDDTLVTLNLISLPPHKHIDTLPLTLSPSVWFAIGTGCPKTLWISLFGDTQNPTEQGPEQPAPSLIRFEWEGALDEFQPKLLCDNSVIFWRRESVGFLPCVKTVNNYTLFAFSGLQKSANDQFPLRKQLWTTCHPRYSVTKSLTGGKSTVYPRNDGI